jgi:Trp operon repressor
MANMSYCRFHNTTTDLVECVNIVKEAYQEGTSLEAFQATLSEDEYRAFRTMIRLSKTLIEYTDEMDQFETVDEEA